MSPRLLLSRAEIAGLGAAAIVLLAGCGTDPGSHRHAGSPAAPPSARSQPAPPEMEAHARYFGGQLKAEVLLGRSAFAPRAEGPTADRGERGRGGPPPGGFGGGRRGGGPGSGGTERGGGPPRTRPDGESAPNLHASNVPPVLFRLRLTNHEAAPLEVEITEFNSALGNFVVLPRKLEVPAGGSAEVDPMTSRLGLSADEVPLTLAIRSPRGTEKQVLTLRPRTSPAPAPTPASPSVVPTVP